MSKELDESIKNKLLKRFEPRKPNGDFRDWGCPKCDATLEYKYPYCPYCGKN